MRSYRLSGEFITSEVVLDDFAPRVDAWPQPTMVLTLAESRAQTELGGAVVNQFDSDGVPFHTVTRLDRHHVVRLHGFADYEIDHDGVHARCFPAPECPPAMLGQVFVDRVLPNMVSHRRPVLHASAVALNGRAAALLGDSGLGKSTLGSVLCPPAEWMCDDSTVLQWMGDGLVVHPSYPFARVWNDSGTEKVRLRREVANAPVALGVAFLLRRGDGLSIEPVTPRDAVAEIARHLYRLDPTDRSLLERELETLERMSEAVEVLRLGYPRRFDELGRVRDAVLERMSST